MSTTIDERVVSMRFDNQRFESNVSTTMSTLNKLKQSLNLTGATKGLENVDQAAKRVDMSGLASGVETVRAKFSALQVMGITALTNITNQAVNAGKRIASALTIDPIKTGFSEYETQIGAVQTILANTQSKGSTLQDVNSALDELNTYADKTIYNFTEMTRNIGTFTAAGVDLNKSVTSIKGIANLAAVSGSTSQQASTAMYQLSQALAAGKVQLMDWNSVVNAGMGGQVFQDALKRTATNMGKDVDGLIKKYGSFRESLTQGDWLTADVLTETLTQLSGAYDEADLLAKGYTKSQTKEILELADTAVDAATKVKTVTQLWDTLKESAQSGWTQSWEIMVGDFEEAKETLTKVSDTIGAMIGESAEARNKLLEGGLSSGWKQLLGAGIADEAGFQDTIKEVAKSHGVNFDKMAKKNETFEETLTRGLKNGKIDSDMLTESVTKMANKMSKMSDEELKAAGYTKEHVKQIKKLSKGLKDGSISMDDFVKKIMRPSGRQNIIDSLWNTFDALMSIVKPIKEAFRDIFPAATGEQLYSLTKNLKEFTEGLKISEDVSKKIKRTFKGLFSILDILRKGISAVVGGLFDLSQSEGIGSLADFILDITASIGDFFTSINEGFDGDGISGGLSKVVSGISNFISKITDGLSGFADILSTVGGYVIKAVNYIWDGIKTAFNWITDNISIGDVFAGLAGGGIFMAAKKFVGLIDKIKDSLSNLFEKKSDKGPSKFSEILDSIKGSLDSFTSGIKVWSLVGIAASITLIASSMEKISALDVGDITKSLAAIGIGLGILTGSFKSITKSLSLYDSKGVIKASVSMMLIAKAIDILAAAITKLSKLSLKELGKGLIGVGGGMVILTKGLKAINGVKINLRTSAAMLVLAESCGKLADTLSKFGKMEWDEIARGLVAMGGALGELVLALKILDEFGGISSLLGSASLLIVVQSLDDLADGLKKFSKMQWDDIGRGLAGMGGALSEVSTVTGVLGKLAGFSGILGGSALVIAVQSLGDLADNLKKFGKMDWGEIGRGLAAMGGALLEVSGISGALGYLAGFSSILGGAAIWTSVQSLSDLADAFKEFGSMTWSEIGRGLAAMGGALLEVGGISGALGYLAGFAGILGGAAIWVTVQSLRDLADAFASFGEMSWSEIGRGLTAMGGALLEVGGISGGLGYLAGFASILGGAAIWISVQGLGDLADALKKFGEMSWGEIGRGLTAMGAALTELAFGGLLDTLAIIGSVSIATAAEPLGDLADALKKFGSMSWDEINQGIIAMDHALAILAAGGFINTLSILGSLSIAAVAKPLGDLADSVKKWKDVTIPDGLGGELAKLAGGVACFTFDGLGAWAISEAAPGLGEMADAVAKWSDVTLREGLCEDLSSLATSIKEFTWAFMGGWSLDAVVGPLGDLAGDITKWANVTIPEGLGTSLSDLATGVKAFTFGGNGASALTEAAPGIGVMADSVKKWVGITIPEEFVANISAVADGVKKFIFTGSGADSIATCATSLGVMADSVKKWVGVTIPENFITNMNAVADGINNFSAMFNNGDERIATAAVGLGTMADSVKKWANVKIPEGFSTTLSDLSDAINKMSGVDDISDTASGLDSLATSASKLTGITYSTISDGFSSLAKSISTLKKSSKSIDGLGSTIYDEIVTPLKNTADDLSSIGTDLIGSIATGMESGKKSVSTAVESIVTSTKKAITDKNKTFVTAGKGLMTNLEKGIKNKNDSVSKTGKSTAGKAATGAKDKYGAMVSAGTYLGAGLVEGIEAKEEAAYNAGYALGQAAVQGEKDGQQSNSPSKLTIKAGKWIGEGLIIGLNRMTSKVYDSGYDMGNSVTQSISSAIAKVSEMVDSDVDVQPTIRPVLDLSGVESDANTIGKLLGGEQSIGVTSNLNAISSMMNRRNQNGTNNDVVSAIEDLKKTIGNTGNSYNINGISYSEGDDVADILKSLVRAVKIDGRA